jgi:hypothetical protein
VADPSERGSWSPSEAQLSGGFVGVWMMPGATALTRMPRVAYSMASNLVAEV